MATTIKKMEEITSFSEEELANRKIVHRRMHQREILNTFRDFRTQLLQKSGRNNFVTLVTSVMSHGGSSFVSTNLSAAFALDPNRTAILVECDIYCMSKNTLLIGTPGPGITDYLVDENLAIEDIIYATGIPRLRVIPVGEMHESGAEAFNSERMERFLSHLKARHADRYIFVDAPPASSAEARILAQLCDFTLLVVPYGKVTQSDVESAIDGLGAGRVTGVIFNN
ncbi:MAG: CpsD/CapB family tyrosine-protein kinase [Gammaproteobacteria bacterium]